MNDATRSAEIDQIERLKAHIERVQSESHDFKLKWKSEVGGLRGMLSALADRNKELVAMNTQLRTALTALVSYTEACEGMLNASPAGQVTAAKDLLAGVKYGCHIDINEIVGGPDECVLDLGKPEDCMYARKYGEEARKHCGEWKPVAFR